MILLKRLFSWWEPYYHCFLLAFLITLALAPRMVHGIDSIIVMWINFLPVVCMLWNTAKRVPNTRLIRVFRWSLAHYALFHSHYFWPSGEWYQSMGVQFWPVSVISVTLLTLFTFFEMRDTREAYQ